MFINPMLNQSGFPNKMINWRCRMCSRSVSINIWTCNDSISWVNNQFILRHRMFINVFYFASSRPEIYLQVFSTCVPYDDKENNKFVFIIPSNNLMASHFSWDSFSWAFVSQPSIDEAKWLKRKLITYEHKVSSNNSNVLGKGRSQNHVMHDNAWLRMFLQLLKQMIDD